MRLYLAGPMRHYPGHNFREFNRVATLLRAATFEVVNPVDINPDATQPWEQCLKQDIMRLVHCEAVAVIPGWALSRGAALEVHIAQALRMPVRPYHVWLEKASAHDYRI